MPTSSLPKPRGRHFFANPGPTNIPDSVLRAMDRGSIDFNDPEFVEVYEAAFAGVKRVLRTKQHLFMYNASGHGAWEASLTNLLSPGDTVLVLESGYFSDEWAAMARSHGLEVRVVEADWRRGVDIADVRKALAADTAHAIKAVCVVHNETATGMMLPLPAIREAIDAAGHPALFLVDTISSLGSLEFRMDDWKIDCVVGGSQKGLMLPTGMSFTGVSDKALAAHRQAKLHRFYFDWTMMEGRSQKSFIGTIPVNIFYGLRESVRLLDEEGIDNVTARHSRLAEATRRAVKVWAGNNGPQLFCLTPDRYSDSVTAILMPEGFNGDALRKTVRERFNVSLGGGLGKLGGKIFRIGHLGDLNEPMLLGALTAIEMALRIDGIPHGRGGVEAAMAFLAGE
ncbi:MAG TPA: aminotransferase class V-fold PLP-dependent enzyme [Rhodopila sp.]|jgi:alanine-glyoxylate transaminase/serine-glyoxylate transaminase/serine-pyruvate transaminase|nr:aminotransferase class V-fold PLP-dependent enzyme [Rhodopila sp.]